MKPEPCIIIDSREQNPLDFPTLTATVGTLDTGDYSIVGLTNLVAVERKSIDDLLTCIGRERDRFKRELQRLRAYRFRLLVVEASAADLEAGQWRSNLKPAHVVGSLAAWCVQYGLPIWLAGDHGAAGRFVEKFLYQCARTLANEYEAATGFLPGTEPVAAAVLGGKDGADSDFI
ncbi:MAG: ERCC4 domain-containing protein [Planctomycetota bacterium]